MTCCWDCRQTPETKTTLTNSSSSDTFIGLIQNSHGLQININIQEKGSLQQEFALVGVHLGFEEGNLQNRERKTWMTTTSHVLIYSELLTEGTSEWRGDAKTEEKKKLFILCGQLRETGSQSVSYKRYQRWRGSARACGRDRERERAGERREGNVEGGREGEVLQATGYLSLHNGVSYEKTSVNFLSDLQQSITQSSHSANLWSRALTESCHCSQPPNTQSPTLVSLIFPCNVIQLFSPSPRSREPLKAGDLGIYEGKEQSLGNVHCRLGSCRGGAGHFTFTQPTLDGVIQPLKGQRPSPLWWWWWWCIKLQPVMLTQQAKWETTPNSLLL